MKPYQGAALPTYDDFSILLDGPAQNPDSDSRRMPQPLPTSSRAVAPSSRWASSELGSGKTTLMRTIERELKGRNDVVTVWFTAWRYEKEPHL